MRTFKLTLAYDGSAYSGWQAQAGQRTLQVTLEDAIGRITGETLRVEASGRTDAGVHAQGQVVSFDSDTHLPVEKLQRALNAELPRDFAVVQAVEAPAGFHARRYAKRKRYRYVLRDGLPDVFDRNYSWYVPQPVDVAAMQRAARALEGTHDFCSFQSSGSRRVSSVRTVYELSVKRDPRDVHRIHVEIEADGFLYNMVRAIVGTLLKVGRGVRPEGWPAEVLAGRDRQLAGRTAPAQGLCLLWVQYDEPSG